MFLVGEAPLRKFGAICPLHGGKVRHSKLYIMYLPTKGLKYTYVPQMVLIRKPEQAHVICMTLETNNKIFR